MGSYHSSFTYLNKNSSEQGFLITSFEPDSGFVDTYLGMDQVTTDFYDGTKKHFYGNKYNSFAQIDITFIKFDGSDFSMADNRRVLRWLTGNRQASWIDLYVGDKLVYSFYGSVTACQQQKMDARIIGMKLTFSSLHPWAWSAPQYFNCPIGGKTIDVDDAGVIFPIYLDKEEFGINNNGVIYNNNNDESFLFAITDDGVICNNESVGLDLYNPSDELYTLTNLDVVYKNGDSATSLIIDNQTLEAKSIIEGIKPLEEITLSAGQFIVSNSSTPRVFGDDFNFVWPQLCPGVNQFQIEGSGGSGTVEFSYRCPIKIGDCAINIEDLSKDPICQGDISGIIDSDDDIDTLGRKNVMFIDYATNEPYIALIKNGKLYISKSKDSRNESIVFIDEETNKLYKIIIKDGSLYPSEVEAYTGIINKNIVLVDQNTDKPYEIVVRNGILYLSEIQTYGGE